MSDFAAALLDQVLGAGKCAGVVVHEHLVRLDFVAGPVKKHDGNPPVL